MTERPPDISVVVPVVERPSPLVALYEEFAAPLRARGWSFEFVFAAHPWFAAVTAPLQDLVARGEPIRVFESGQSVGETALLKVAAAQFCRGRIIVTLPAYRQVEAGAVPGLIDEVEAGADVAVARRWPRRDSLINRFQSRVLHLFVGRLAGWRLHDVACSVRAVRAEVLRDVALYGDFGRFLPLFAAREGYRVMEVASPVHPGAMHGRVYGPGVYLRRLVDVLGLLFLLRFTEKPLRFFGLVGAAVTSAGAVVLAVLLIQRIQGQGIADRPLLLLGVLLVTLGLQTFALGLIGEMIVHLTASRRRTYRLRTQAEGRPPPGASP